MNEPTPSSRNSRIRLIAIAALGTIAVAAIVLVVTRDSTPSMTPTETAGASLGGAEPKAALWKRLQSLESWLPTFAAALRDPEPDPKTVLAAFATVADKVGGNSGFWRDTVPNELLRCDKDDSPACKRLAESLPEITEGEALARQIRRLDETRAGLYLSRNAKTLGKWLDDFAPRDASHEAMRQTGFWEKELSPAASSK